MLLFLVTMFPRSITHGRYVSGRYSTYTRVISLTNTRKFSTVQLRNTVALVVCVFRTEVVGSHLLLGKGARVPA